MERLNLLFQELGATNTAVAQLAGFDSSNISRIRNGSRTQAPLGPTTQKLIRGIYLFSLEKEKLTELCALISCDPESPEEKIREALLRWLYAEDPLIDRQSEFITRFASFHSGAAGSPSFSEKLNAAMQLSGLSNVRLSQLLHVDASLISRYRSGVRFPKSNPRLAAELSSALFQRMEQLGIRPALAKLMRVPEETLNENEFSRWLWNPDKAQGSDSPLAEALLEAFDSYSMESRLSLPSPEEAVSDSILADTRTLYYGTKGLREAVLRFLGTVCRSGFKTLLLYSDEDMGWMTDDTDFRLKWASLMSSCVKKGIRIRILHNIGRSLREMNAAIVSWLPLYMSGMIEPMYSRSPAGDRFSHTLFLCPGLACIFGSHAKGAEEENGIYYYETDPKLLEIREINYLHLTEDAQPLVSIRPFEAAETIRKQVLTIQNTLSIGSMPEEVLKQFESPELKREWELKHSLLETWLDSGCEVLEYMPLAEDDRLFADCVPACRVPGGENLCYSPESYSRHIRHIIHLMDSRPNYHLIPLQEAPFSNMRILIASDFVTVTRCTGPSASFRFTHPLMCRAFQEYGKQLAEGKRMDRLALRRRLQQRYL